MHDRLRRAIDRLIGAPDQLGPSLRQDLDLDALRDGLLLNDLAHELEVGIGRRWETDLDLGKAHVDERQEHLPLAVGIHGLDQCLVPIA